MPHPFIPGTDICRVEMFFSLFSQSIENVYHWKYTPGSPSDTELGALASYHKTWWTTNVGNHMSNQISLTKIKVRLLTTETSPWIEYVTGLPSAGVGANPAVPSNVAVPVKFTTGLTGRSYRGRTYVTGFDTGAISADTLSGAAITWLLNAYNLFLTAPPADFVFGIFSQYNNDAWRTSGVFTPVTTISTNGYVGSQRRRLLGRGM